MDEPITRTDLELALTDIRTIIQSLERDTQLDLETIKGFGWVNDGKQTLHSIYMTMATGQCPGHGHTAADIFDIPHLEKMSEFIDRVEKLTARVDDLSKRLANYEFYNTPLEPL